MFTLPNKSYNLLKIFPPERERERGIKKVKFYPRVFEHPSAYLEKSWVPFKAIQL